MLGGGIRNGETDGIEKSGMGPMSGDFTEDIGERTCHLNQENASSFRRERKLTYPLTNVCGVQNCSLTRTVNDGQCTLRWRRLGCDSMKVFYRPVVMFPRQMPDPAEARNDSARHAAASIYSLNN